ncbi:MAG: glycosyltransferase family 39 protein [Myxococcales bacterium]|nr:glycosyltransferase family 39 protein [Myxococcales bacterium]
MAFAVGWLLPNPPLDEDDWYFFAIGRWLSAHATDAEALGRLFSEYGNHREPIWRPVTNLWFGLEYAAFGTVWWAWRVMSAVLHVVTGLLVAALGRELKQSKQATHLAAALYLVHPAFAETISWINAQETQVMVILALGAVIVLVRGRWLVFGGLLTAMAALSKEQGVVVPGLVVASLLFDGGWRRVMSQWAPVLMSGAVIAVLLGVRFAVLREAENLAHVDYLQHFASAWTPGTVVSSVWGLVVLTVVPTVAGFGWTYGFGSAAAAALWTAVAMMQRVAEVKVGRRGVLALAWLLIAASPALAEVALPTLDDAAGVTPDWNLRHLNLALVGPALFGGDVLARLLGVGRRWARLGLIVALLTVHAALLLAHCGPYAAIGARLIAATPHLAAPWPENRALRIVEPRDTIAAAARFRTFATELSAIPLLVGEPRCGCARVAAAPDMTLLSSLRELTKAFYEVHEEIDEIGDVGGPCRCPRWRIDAEFVRLEGGPGGPFRAVLDR